MSLAVRILLLLSATCLGIGVVWCDPVMLLLSAGMLTGAVWVSKMKRR